MFTVTLPYEIGTFVKVFDMDYKRNIVHKDELLYCGTVAAYTVGNNNEYAIWVSQYKEACTGEYMVDQVVPMEKEEIDALIKKYKDYELPNGSPEGGE